MIRSPAANRSLQGFRTMTYVDTVHSAVRIGRSPGYLL
jgi:hypothetical protein